MGVTYLYILGGLFDKMTVHINLGTFIYLFIHLLQFISITEKLKSTEYQKSKMGKEEGTVLLHRSARLKLIVAGPFAYFYDSERKAKWHWQQSYVGENCNIFKCFKQITCISSMISA